MAGAKMSSFQRRCHKILRKNGWELRRFTGSGHALYEKEVNGKIVTTTVSGSPGNADQALKAVMKCANIRL